MLKIPFYLAIAQYRLKRKYPRGAIDQYIKVLALRPNWLSIRKKLAYWQYKDGQYIQSIGNIDKIIATEGETGDQILLKARNLVKLDDEDQALQIFNSLTATSHSGYQALVFEGGTLLSQDEWVKARSSYEAAYKHTQTGEEQSYCLHSIGYTLEQQGDISRASDYYDKAVEAHPQRLPFGIATLHARRRWDDLALSKLKSLSDSDNKNPELWFQLGRVYRRLKQDDEAAEAYLTFAKLSDPMVAQGEIDNNLIVFDAFMGRKVVDSPKEIFDYIRRNKEYRNFRFVWVLSGRSWTKFWRLYLNPRVKVVKYASREYFKVYARAKYWVTNSRLPLIKRSSDKQVYVQCWHGTPLKRIGHDIAGSRQGADNKYSSDELGGVYSAESKKLDYFISPSRFASEKFISSFALDKFGKESAIIEEGYPRNDPLITASDRDITRLRRKYKIPKGKKALLYAPTWRDNSRNDKGYTFDLEIDFDKLQSQLSDEWVILFRPHYFIANAFNFHKYDGFIQNVAEVDDINELYLISDALMTDYSSVFFDYANLQRPILFYMYDLEYYMEDLRGFYIDLDELPGKIVKTENEIISVLNDLKAYNEAYKGKYKVFNDTYNYLDDGRATKRVARKVLDER